MSYQSCPLKDPDCLENLLPKLSAKYTEYTNLKSQTERILNSVTEHPELVDTHKRLVETDRQVRELLIAQSNKTFSVNVGEEATNLVDTINDNDSTNAQVKRVQAKRLAKRLYSMHHPDKGGTVEMFDTIHQAANDGDLDTLMYFRLRDGVETYSIEEVKTLIQKIDIKLQQFKGTQSFQVARYYYSNREQFIRHYKNMLEQKIQGLVVQLFGLTVSQPKTLQETRHD